MDLNLVGALDDTLTAGVRDDWMEALDNASYKLDKDTLRIETKTLKNATFLAKHAETIASKIYTFAYQYNLPIKKLWIGNNGVPSIHCNVETERKSKTRSRLSLFMF